MVIEPIDSSVADVVGARALDDEGFRQCQEMTRRASCESGRRHI